MGDTLAKLVKIWYIFMGDTLAKLVKICCSGFLLNNNILRRIEIYEYTNRKLITEKYSFVNHKQNNK